MSTKAMADYKGPRETRPAELDSLLILLNGVFRARTHSMQQEHPYVYCLENAANLRIVLHDGTPVSHFGIKFWDVSLLGVRIKVASVGGVCTHPDYRGQGLATVLLEDAARLMHREETDVIYVSGGRGLYIRNGYAPAGVERLYVVPADCDRQIDSEPFSLQPHAERALQGLAALYSEEPVRYARSSDEWRSVVAGRLARRPPDQFLTVRNNKRDVAYLNLSINPAGGSLHLWEYAGDRKAVLCGLALVMRDQGAGQVTMHVLWHDTAMITQLQRIGLTGKSGTISDHTIKIPNFQRFMNRMRPVFAQRIKPETLNGISFENRGEGGRIASDSEHYDFEDSHAVTNLVFSSPEQIDNPADRSMPGPVKEFVSRALPLPFVWPGISYV